MNELEPSIAGAVRGAPRALFLDRDGVRLHGGGEIVHARRGDDHDLFRREPADGFEQPADQRPAGERMQRLGQIGRHARSLAGGEDDAGERAIRGAQMGGFIHENDLRTRARKNKSLDVAAGYRNIIYVNYWLLFL